VLFALMPWIYRYKAIEESVCECRSDDLPEEMVLFAIQSKMLDREATECTSFAPIAVNTNIYRRGG
jgi:hypothetical protein